MPDSLGLKAGGPTRAARRAFARAPASAREHPREPAGRAETVVFRLAMGAAGLWVLDDAFWHREPGTAVGDHLASGLVPVALAALLAVAYPRLRAGARGGRGAHGRSADDRRRRR